MAFLWGRKGPYILAAHGLALALLSGPFSSAGPKMKVKVEILPICSFRWSQGVKVLPIRLAIVVCRGPQKSAGVCKGLRFGIVVHWQACSSHCVGY